MANYHIKLVLSPKLVLRSRPSSYSKSKVTQYIVIFVSLRASVSFISKNLQVFLQKHCRASKAEFGMCMADEPGCLGDRSHCPWQISSTQPVLHRDL